MLILLVIRAHDRFKVVAVIPIFAECGHEVEFQMVRNALPRRFGAPGLPELIAFQARILIKLVDRLS
uniref:Regulator of nonsense transcripts 1 homolog n=1 Tax=Tanacetum cinerariifolium TaxID=118510 RepID=A0A6L2M1H1_TANCI|nr:regulator of nonsense transcripts 1 homolog [Tanacetum cinerariifolium]